jgi:hypothetical protein
MVSERQKVVVLDDQYEDVKTLLQAFGRKGVPYLYLDGTIENLPEKPFKGIRILFLDIELDTKGLSASNMASALVNRLVKIIGNKSYPFFIVFWTKNPSHIEEVIKYLKSQNIAPVDYIDLEKPNSPASVDDMILKIDTKLQELKAYNYLLEWEEIVEESLSDFSNDVFPSYSSQVDIEKWSHQAMASLGTLAMDYTGKEVLENNTNDLRHAFLMLINSFHDSIQRNISSKKLSLYMPLLKEKLDFKQIAGLNSSLFINYNPEKYPSFGNVFLANNDIYSKNSVSSTKKHGKKVNEQFMLFYQSFSIGIKKPIGIRTIGMIVTPSCDMALGKYLTNKNRKCFQILYGLMIPVNEEFMEKSMKKFKKSPSQFLIEPFFNVRKEEIYIIIFNFSSLSSVWWRNNEVPPFLLSVNEHLAFDIQSKMASHINRLGNFMITSRK